MSGRSSPVNGGYEVANVEPAMRLTVRKDLFPQDRLSELTPVVEGADDNLDEMDDISYIKLETDFEKSIDDIASQSKQLNNGIIPFEKSKSNRHRKHKQHSRRDSERSSAVNGCLPTKSKKKKRSSSESKSHRKSKHIITPPQVKGGKNLNLVSSSECQESDDVESNASLMNQEEDSSDDEVLKEFSVKLPIISVPRQSGKPYSHELSQLSSKKSKSKDSRREKRTHFIVPCSGKPRSMLGIISSRSKKKSKKMERKSTYHSQIVGLNAMKIKIKRTSNSERVTPTTALIPDLGQRKPKKKREASPVAESSGEEYDPSKGDTAAVISVSAPKPRHPPTKAKKTTPRHRGKSEKTERACRVSTAAQAIGPQSPWASMPIEILTKIFENVVAMQGTLPTVLRLGRVCKLWHTVSCEPVLWRNIDLAQYTSDKWKIDYKLVWLLENRLSKCHTLNISHWKVCNVAWVLACIADYCPELQELGIAGWSRLTADQLYDIFNTLPMLKRIDLSLTSEQGGSGTCLSAASVARVVENFGDRITHLNLANNKFTALQQILTSIAGHCPNLEVLDISGARATSHPAAVPLEALQKGCPKVRVFRAANAQLVLASATTAQQMETQGWAHLEELSVAGEAATERVAVGEYRLNDDALSRLVRGATRLKLLDLRGLQKVTDSGLVRVPAWDLQHLFLGGCNVTRQSSACLELICQKWSHTLIELDLSWSSAARVIDDAVTALADSTESKLKILNLCGSSVSLEPVKKVLRKCTKIESLNLSSCRALPRGIKRLYTGKELQDLKDSFDTEKIKAKDMQEKSAKKDKKCDSVEESTSEELTKNSESDTSPKLESKTDKSSSSMFQEPKTPIDSESSKHKTSPDCKSIDSIDRLTSPSEIKLPSPIVQPKPDSSSTPRSETSNKTYMGSPHFSPVAKPDSQVQNSPDIQVDQVRSNSSWNLSHFKTTPTHKSEASPINRIEFQGKLKHSKMVEQCSPTTSLENKLSPDAAPIIKQDIKTPNSRNYGSYSPMPRQENQFSSQRSPYSAQPSPAQPSPYSAQPSPYSTQPSPYSSQPSPYSAQPSPDTSQIVKSELQKSSSAWNTGNYSPMPKNLAPFSPYATTHTSPDPGVGMKGDSLRNNPNKTPGQYSPMSRQDRIHQSPYSPRPSVENVAYSNKKSPGVGNYSPLMRSDCHLPSPDTGQTSRSIHSSQTGRTQDIYGRTVSKTAADLLQNITSDLSNSWGLDKFNQLGGTQNTNVEYRNSGWSGQTYPTEANITASAVEEIAAMLNTPSPQPWNALPSFDSTVRRQSEDPWNFGQFRVEPPHQVHNNFIDPSISLSGFDSLSGHIGHQSRVPNFMDDNFTETSRVD